MKSQRCDIKRQKLIEDDKRMEIGEIINKIEGWMIIWNLKYKCIIKQCYHTA